jgi:cyclopropane fatty-acyl-phospholipid synthase-like methyltransferase
MNITWSEPEQFITVAKEKMMYAEIVLDIGCGIRPQDYIKPRVHICCDPNLEYINYLQKHLVSYSSPVLLNEFKTNPFCTLEPSEGTSYIFVNAGWEEVLEMFPEKSVDSIFLMNVIEHLDKEKSEELLAKTEKVARGQLVIFASSANGIEVSEDPWGFKRNRFQKIRSNWNHQEFNDGWELLGCKRFDVYGSKGGLVKDTGESFYGIKNLIPFNMQKKAFEFTADEYAETLSKLGEYILSNDNDPDKAQGYFMRALEIKPEYSEAVNNLGAVAWMKGSKEEALEYFNKAYKIDPSNKVYVENTVDVLLSFDLKREAKEVLSRYLEYYSNDEEMKQRYLIASGKEWEKETQSKTSNLEFWRKMQDENYFENHVFYGAGSNNLPLYGSDIELINNFIPLNKNMNVAVIGCGYGRESVLIGPHVKHIYGIDVNQKILGKALKYVNKHGVSNFTPVLADSWRREIKEKIDLVFEVTVFQHLTRDLTKDYISGFTEKLNTDGKMLLQFLDCDYGTRDAELTAYEPTVVWNMKDIEEVVEEFNLSILKFENIKWPEQNAGWHWVLFAKK